MRNRFIIITNKYILKFAFRIVNNNADKQQKGGFLNPYILYIPIKIPAYKLNKLIDKTIYKNYQKEPKTYKPAKKIILYNLLYKRIFEVIFGCLCVKAKTRRFIHSIIKELICHMPFRHHQVHLHNQQNWHLQT